ncbi:MAG: transporter, ATP-binding protein [Frankiales bacterium]|nr:transporter, ATP-binding protein [Frankiales bacterium]
MRRCFVQSDSGSSFCRGVSKTHLAATGPVQALVDVSLELPSGAVTVVMGRSGSGKSTLLRLLACLERPDEGEIVLDGTDVLGLSERRRRRMRKTRIGYVFSRPSDNLLPYLRAQEQLDLAAGLRGLGKKAARDLLEPLGLGHRARSLPEQLSGGERQRLAFAAAAVGGPTLLVADEPTAELDSASVAILLGQMSALAAGGTAVVVASHDPRLLEIGDHVVRLEDGQVVA